MADIELVIKMPEKVYKSILDINALGCGVSDIKKIIRNGTPCEDAIRREEVLDIINFVDIWLYDMKSHTAETKRAMEMLKSHVRDLPPIIGGEKESDK